LTPRQCSTRWTRTWNHSAFSGRLFSNSEGWRPWRLSPHHACPQFCAGDG
jgi:hypothetical protein